MKCKNFPNALNSLRYFCEEASEYHFARAGSFLGIRLSKTSFPVGKVDFLNLYPMTLSEFLIADDSEILVEVMRKTKEVSEIPESFKDRLNILYNWWNAKSCVQLG